MEGLLQLLLYGFIYWLIMGRRSKKKKAARERDPKPAPGSTAAPQSAAERPMPEPRPERTRPGAPFPADRPGAGRGEVFEADEGEFHDPFDELREVLMQEGRAEERGYRPSRDRSPDLRGRLERMRERRSEAERRRAEKLRALEAEREGYTVADAVAFDDERDPPRQEASRESAVDRPGERRRRAGKSAPRRRHALLANLRDAGRVREAIVLREVLGPPVAKRGPLGTSMRTPRDR